MSRRCHELQFQAKKCRPNSRRFRPMFGLKSQEGHYALRSIKNINNSKEMTKWTVQHVVMAWMVVALVECVAGLPAFPLSTKGSVVVDADGNRVKFAGV